MHRLLLVVLTICCAACIQSGPPLSEVGIEEIQAVGISSYQAHPLVSFSDGSGWSSEACIDEPTSDNIFVHQIDLVADTTYEVNYYHTTMSCRSNSITLDAKLYVFDAQNRVIASAETGTSGSVDFRLSPTESDTYYIAIAPTYKNDTGGYTLVLTMVDGN